MAPWVTKVSSPAHMLWPEFFDVYIFWPCVVVLICLPLTVPLKLMYEILMRITCLRHFVHDFVGSPAFPQVKIPFFQSSLYFLQLVASTMTVGMWWKHTYPSANSQTYDPIKDVLNIFYICHWVFLRFRAGFHPWSVFAPGSLIDIFTVVPYYITGPSGLFEAYIDTPIDHRWLSLEFLRVWRASIAYDRLKEVADVQQIGKLTDSVITLILRSLGLIICMMGVIITAEVLGEIPTWEDQFVTITNQFSPDDASSVSPFFLFYWMVTTISTVGYGDFYPTLGVSRFFVVVCFVSGVVFFANEISELTDLKAKVKSGKHKYIKGKDPHVVVVGGNVGRHSAFIKSFLTEVLHPQSVSTHSDIVLMSEEGFDDDLKVFVRTSLALEKQRRVFMLTGNAMETSDLDRANVKTCFGVYIIPDVTTADPEGADCQNIMRTLHLMRYHPTLHYKLVLVDVASRIRAVSLGLQQANCFALNEFKALMVAQASRVRGFMPLAVGLFKDVDLDAERRPLEKQIDGSADPAFFRSWLPDYLDGLSWTPRGFLAAADLEGKEFNEVAAKLLDDSDGDILLLAAISNGIRLNWKGQLRKGQLLIALIRFPLTAKAEATLAGCADGTRKWQDECHNQFGDLLVNELVAKLESEAVKRGASSQDQRKAEDGSVADYQGFLPVGRDGTTAPETSTTADGTIAPMLAGQVDYGSTITIVLPDKNLWVMLDYLLQTLRSKLLVDMDSPIVVVSPDPAPHRLKNHFEQQRVTFFVPEKHNGNWLNLKSTELHKSRQIILLRNHPERETKSGVDVVFSDYRALIQAAMLEHHLDKKDSKSFRIYEFLTTDALRIFQQRSADVASGASAMGAAATGVTDSSYQAQLQEEAEEDEVIAAKSFLGSVKKLTSPLLKVVELLRSFCKGFLVVKNPEVENNPPDRKLCFQWLFASGRAFSAPEIFGLTFAAQHYVPFGLRLLRALCNGVPARDENGKLIPQALCSGVPARDESQNDLLWSVKCPEHYIERTFGELQNAWLRKTDELVDEDGRPTPRYGSDAVLCLAVYRTDLKDPEKPETKTMMPGCNITLPKRSFKLQAGDYITCIGSREFANAARRENLLDDGDAWDAPGPSASAAASQGTVPSSQGATAEVVDEATLNSAIGAALRTAHAAAGASDAKLGVDKWMDALRSGAWMEKSGNLHDLRAFLSEESVPIDGAEKKAIVSGELDDVLKVLQGLAAPRGGAMGEPLSICHI